MSVLQIDGLSHHYGKTQALDQVSLKLEAGEFCVLLGQNGAGKSTLFGLLSRLLAIQSGHIDLFGTALSARQLGRVGMVFQQTTLDLDLSVEQNLSYFAALQGMSGTLRQQRISEELARLQLADHARTRVRTLSGGMRRRVELARALLHRPELLLLDEASVGLDSASRRFIVDHVHHLARHEGMAVLWSTHLADEIAPGHDSLAILGQGRLLQRIASGSLAHDEAAAHALIPFTQSKDNLCPLP